MKKLYLLLISILCLFSVLKAQKEIDFNNFPLLHSSGKIPDDITKMYMEKYNEDKSTMDNSGKRAERKAKDQFLLESNYYLNQLLISGKILFNDPVTEYINGIADVILKDQPELRKTLRFYAVKSASVNAFATDKGIIFVNLGLVAQVTSEAQLAYVLSHEIVHYVKKHNMDFYLTKKKILKGSSYDSEEEDESFLKVHHRSREMESEADNIGLSEYYSKTNYSFTEIDGAMDVLQYAYLPFDDIKFEKSYYENGYFSFPDNYKLDNITPIKGRDDYDDTLSTHPNIKKRRESMQEIIKKYDNANRQAFIQSKDKFIYVKKLARFECINIFIVEQEYDQALYNSYIMLKEYPNNFYLQKAMASSMYLLAKHRLDGTLNKVVGDYKKMEGEQQQMNFLIRKFEKKDICVVALRDIWKLHKQYPKNAYLTSMKDDILKEMFDRINLKNTDFSTSKDTATTMPDTTAIEKAGNKYDRIKLKKKSTAVKEKLNYFNYMLVDLFQDSAFKSNFNDAFEIAQNSKKRNDDEDDDEGYVAKKKKRTWVKLDDELPSKIDNILVYNPVYYKVDLRKTDALKFIASDQKGKEYVERIKNITKMLNIKTKLLIPSEFTSDDVDIYNDYATLKDLLSEAMNISSKSNYVYNSVQYTGDIADKYDTRYINFSGVVSSRIKKSSQAIFNAVIYSILIYPIPFSIYTITVPEYYTVYFQSLFDIKTGKVLFERASPFNYRDRNDFLNSQLYDSFNKIKYLKKYKTKH